MSKISAVKSLAKSLFFWVPHITIKRFVMGTDFVFMTFGMYFGLSLFNRLPKWYKSYEDSQYCDPLYGDECKTNHSNWKITFADTLQPFADYLQPFVDFGWPGAVIVISYFGFILVVFFTIKLYKNKILREKLTIFDIVEAAYPFWSGIPRCGAWV